MNSSRRKQETPNSNICNPSSLQADAQQKPTANSDPQDVALKNMQHEEWCLTVRAASAHMDCWHSDESLLVASAILLEKILDVHAAAAGSHGNSPPSLESSKPKME